MSGRNILKYDLNTSLEDLNVNVYTVFQLYESGIN